MRAPRILIAGATGYVGRALVAEGLRRGWTVGAHLRPDSPSSAEVAGDWEAAGVQLLIAPWEAAALGETVAAFAPTAAFALLGTTRARTRASGGLDTYERIDLGYSLLLLRACEQEASGALYVYLSSMGVREGAATGYLGARARMEAALRASPQPHCILRPSFISGSDRPEDRPAERIAATVSGKALGVLGRLGARGFSDRWAPHTGAEVAGALAEASIDAGCRGETLSGTALQALVDRWKAGASVA